MPGRADQANSKANRANRGSAPACPGPSPKADPGPSPAIKPKAKPSQTAARAEPGPMIRHVHHRSTSSNYRRQAPVFALEMCSDLPVGCLDWRKLRHKAPNEPAAVGFSARQSSRGQGDAALDPAEMRPFTSGMPQVKKGNVDRVCQLSRRMRRIRRLHAGDAGAYRPRLRPLCSFSVTTGPRMALEATSRRGRCKRCRAKNRPRTGDVADRAAKVGAAALAG